MHTKTQFRGISPRQDPKEKSAKSGKRGSKDTPSSRKSKSSTPQDATNSILKNRIILYLFKINKKLKKYLFKINKKKSLLNITTPQQGLTRSSILLLKAKTPGIMFTVVYTNLRSGNAAETSDLVIFAEIFFSKKSRENFPTEHHFDNIILILYVRY
jgi:hypothetical protein